MSPLGSKSAKKGEAAPKPGKADKAAAKAAAKAEKAAAKQAAKAAKTSKSAKSPAAPPSALRGVVVEKPKADIYTVLLALSFVALLIGCVALYLEMSVYDLQIKARL